MGPVSRHLPVASRHVIVRFSLKLAVFLIICGLQTRSGGPNPFFEGTALAAALCVVLALHARERPMGHRSTTGTRPLPSAWFPASAAACPNSDDITGSGIPT
jgi:hypothetical protein